MSFITALRAEVAKLEAELSRNLTFQRLQEARRMLDLYEDDSPKDAGRPFGDIVAERIASNAFRRIAKPGVRLPSAEKVRVLDEAHKFLETQGGKPVPTSAIYEHLAELGIPIGGTDPKNNLSAMLSNSPTFHSNGRFGWTLMADEVNRLMGTESEPESTANQPRNALSFIPKE